jgi:hypothetical protein
VTEEVPRWRQNGYGFFNSSGEIRSIAEAAGLNLQEAHVFYYEAYEREFDEEHWFPIKVNAEYSPFAPFALRTIPITRRPFFGHGFEDPQLDLHLKARLSDDEEDDGQGRPLPTSSRNEFRKNSFRAQRLCVSYACERSIPRQASQTTCSRYPSTEQILEATLDKPPQGS